MAWISYFPVEWLPDVPSEIRNGIRAHPATWQQVLLKELERCPGLKLHIISLGHHYSQTFNFERNGVQFHLIKVPPRLRAPSLFWLDTFVIKRILRQVRPHVVHGWGTEKGAALVASRLAYPYLITIQGLLSWYRELVPLNSYERLASHIEEYCLPRTPVVTTESTVAVNFLQRKFPGLHIEQIEHAPDWMFHEVQRKARMDPLRFIFVGTFDYRKGADILLDALDRLVSEMRFELVVVGQAVPSLLDGLRKRTSAHLWKRIEFKVQLQPPEVAQQLAEATMMIFPTRADTSPNAVKEAVVAGVPVVASSIGGINDYVFPGKNGLLFRSENVSECVTSIRAAVQHPLFGRGCVDGEVLRQVRSYLSPVRMGQRFLDVYRSLVRQKQD